MTGYFWFLVFLTGLALGLFAQGYPAWAEAAPGKQASSPTLRGQSYVTWYGPPNFHSGDITWCDAIQDVRRNGRGSFEPEGLTAAAPWRAGRLVVYPCGTELTVTRDDGSDLAGDWQAMFREFPNVTVTITDACQECGLRNLDLSSGAFKRIGSLSEGVVAVRIQEIGVEP